MSVQPVTGSASLISTVKKLLCCPLCWTIASTLPSSFRSASSSESGTVEPTANFRAAPVANVPSPTPGRTAKPVGEPPVAERRDVLMAVAIEVGERDPREAPGAGEVVDGRREGAVAVAELDVGGVEAGPDEVEVRVVVQVRDREVGDALGVERRVADDHRRGEGAVAEPLQEEGLLRIGAAGLVDAAARHEIDDVVVVEVGRHQARAVAVRLPERRAAGRAQRGERPRRTVAAIDVERDRDVGAEVGTCARVGRKVGEAVAIEVPDDDVGELRARVVDDGRRREAARAVAVRDDDPRRRTALHTARPEIHHVEVAVAIEVGGADHPGEELARAADVEQRAHRGRAELARGGERHDVQADADRQHLGPVHR